jgi:hypothetical protein
MDMLWHDHITKDMHAKAPPGWFKRVQENILHLHLLKKRLTVVTTECDEVGLS